VRLREFIAIVEKLVSDDPSARGERRREPFGLRTPSAASRRRDLSKKGLSVFPLWWMENGRCACGRSNCGKSAGKHPIGKLVPHWPRDASSNPAVAKNWWTQYPRANIGIACGHDSDLVVIDVDGPTGRATLERLLTQYDHVLEAKWIVETGREDGGRHYHFKYP
jgi:Bifunctional DNA primase/polymerase, N-terminal